MYVYIKSMSESLTEIRHDIRSAISQLDKHLIKLVLFDKSLSRNHWKGEVYSFLNAVRRAKGSKKFPKYKFIRSAIATDEDILDNYIKQIKSDYRDQVCKDTSDSDVKSVVLAYHDWLAANLSEKGFVTRDEVIEELSRLGL